MNDFSFIDPVIDHTFLESPDFINDMDMFFDTLESNPERPIVIPRPLSEDTYKEMWMLRYQQHLGNISFLEMLDKYEVILGISRPSE